MMSYMGEKTYPVCYRVNDGNVVSYMSPRDIERNIQRNGSYMPFGLYLENCDDLRIEVNNQIVDIPVNLLQRNSNFYIVEN